MGDPYSSAQLRVYVRQTGRLVAEQQRVRLLRDLHILQQNAACQHEREPLILPEPGQVLIDIVEVFHTVMEQGAHGRAHGFRVEDVHRRAHDPNVPVAETGGRPQDRADVAGVGGLHEHDVAARLQPAPELLKLRDDITVAFGRQHVERLRAHLRGDSKFAAPLRDRPDALRLLAVRAEEDAPHQFGPHLQQLECQRRPECIGIGAVAPVSADLHHTSSRSSGARYMPSPGCTSYVS